MTLAHGIGNRLVQETFNRSGETIHRHFHLVLNSVLKLSGDIIKPSANYNEEVPSQILNSSRYYPMFKDCIGAIDGTHVMASVREHEQPKYIGRQGYATQNIMAACDFNMCFTFSWAGWEGTANDTRIFNEALRSCEGPKLIFHVQRVINITLLMLGIQILEVILLHIKEPTFDIIYQIVVVEKLLLVVLLEELKRYLTTVIHH